MTDTVLVALIGAVPSAIAAVLSYGNRRRVEVVISKAQEIHELANSNLTTVKEQLETANAKIERLEAVIEVFQRDNI